MENFRILKQQRFQSSRKAAIVGSLMGAVYSISLFLLAFYIPQSSAEPNYGDGFALTTKQSLVLLAELPAIICCQLLGAESFLRSNNKLSQINFMILAMFLNAFIFCTLGSVFG